MLTDNTPLEPYRVRGIEVLVKREDLCCPFPGPAFSKLRGVYAHIKTRPEGIIGVLDTYHSKAGWAVSYVCEALGKRAINYWSQRKDSNGLLPQQRHAAQMGATLVPLPAGRSAVLYHQAKRDLTNYGDAAHTYMMPNALKLRESVIENAAEARRTAPLLPGRGTIVISISSGTVAAGILAGLAEHGSLACYSVVLHLGYHRSPQAVYSYIASCLGFSAVPIRLVDEGYEYGQPAVAHGDEVAPFPCNPYYDAKSWKWLVGHLDTLAGHGPIVFWNIGA